MRQKVARVLISFPDDEIVEGEVREEDVWTEIASQMPCPLNHPVGSKNIPWFNTEFIEWEEN